MEWPTFWTQIIEAEAAFSWWSIIPTLLGAVVGGAIVFFVDFYFRREEQRRNYIERDYSLYLEINRLIYDVFSTGSIYHDMLGDKTWPLNPASKIRPTIDYAQQNVSFSIDQLSTIRGTNDAGLVHDLFELTNLRNIIISANYKFAELHQSMTTKAVRYSSIGSDTKISADLDHKDPDHRVIIFEMKRIDRLAKEILGKIDDFYHGTLLFARKYNRYKSSHKIKAVQSITIDTTILETLRRDQS